MTVVIGTMYVQHQDGLITDLHVHGCKAVCAKWSGRPVAYRFDEQAHCYEVV